jgi:hypothetical protein
MSTGDDTIACGHVMMCIPFRLNCVVHGWCQHAGLYVSTHTPVTPMLTVLCMSLHRVMDFSGRFVPARLSRACICFKQMLGVHRMKMTTLVGACAWSLLSQKD